MPRESLGLVQGTVDVLILRALTRNTLHGYAISQWIKEKSDGALAVEDAALRRRLRTALGLWREPLWLNQVHGTEVVEAVSRDVPPTADSSFARAPGHACAVLTADCLPVLFCDRDGTRVAAAHAGWRGLAGGVLDSALRAMSVAPERVLAWLGPAIEQDAFEVGAEVREQFLARSADNEPAFKLNARGRWQADLYDLARRELARLGVTQVFGGGFRCYADRDRFFSYRRDGTTGRLATLVWMK